MAQTTLIAAGITTETCANFTIADGASVVIGMFAETGKAIATPGVLATVNIVSPGAPSAFYYLTAKDPVQVVGAPAGAGDLLVNVTRDNLPAGTLLGVFKNAA